jgi:AcrR family transcriptional regulator
MPKEAPLSERILDAAEIALRRYGVEKTNVVDIARALEMSHGNIYRHFPSKQALLNAVAVRWLNAVTSPLAAIADDASRPASERLVAWFDTLRAIKRRKVRDDPELFRVHHEVVAHSNEVVEEHVRTMLGQVEKIIGAGVAAKEFSRKLDVKAAAQAFLHATSPFHHPAMVMQEPPLTDANARGVLDLLLAGLRAGHDQGN